MTCMNKLYIMFAGYVIQLDLTRSEYEQEKKLFLDNLYNVYGGCIVKTTNSKVHFKIVVVHKGFTHTKKDNTDTFVQYYHVVSKNCIETYYSISIFQLSLLLHYVLFHILRDGFFLHASSFIYNANAYIFIGPSGAGKTTTITISRKQATPFADDTLIVQKTGRRFLCYQAPFIDKQSYITKTKKGFPIQGIYILKKSKVVKVHTITRETMLMHLLEALFANSETKKTTSKSLGDFVRKEINCVFGVFYSTGKKSALTTAKITR